MYNLPYRGQIFRIITGKDIIALVFGLVAGILILVSVSGAWVGNTSVSGRQVSSYGYYSYSYNRPAILNGGIGDIQNFYATLESLGGSYSDSYYSAPSTPTVIGSGGGNKYSLLYILIPCGIIVLIFSLIAPFANLFWPQGKKTMASLIMLFSQIGLVLCISGILFVLKDNPGYTYTYQKVDYTVIYSFSLGYAGIIGVTGALFGLIASLLLWEKTVSRVKSHLGYRSSWK